LMARSVNFSKTAVTTSAPRACEKEGNETQSQMSDETHTESVSRKISARSSDVVRELLASDRQRVDARILNASSSVLLFRARVTRQRRETRPVPAGRTLTTARARAKPAVPVRVLLGWRCECFESSRRCLWAGYPRVPGTGRANAFAKSRGKRASRET
jgi:hypothetical protein